MVDNKNIRIAARGCQNSGLASAGNTACLIFMLLISQVLSAQTTLQDVVKLNDGSIYRGLITERSADALKLETEGGNLFVIPCTEIDSTYVARPKNIKTCQFHQKSSGYFSVTSLGVPIGTQQEDYFYYNTGKVVAGFTAQTVHGYRFFDRLLAGAGCGIEIVQDPMLQLFADARYELLKLQYTPYVVADAGYGINLRSDVSATWQTSEFGGGFMWGIGAGMRFNFIQAGAIVFDAQYRVSRRTEEISFPETGAFVNQYTLRRIVLKLGLAF
jgi:hypothetical protein